MGVLVSTHFASVEQLQRCSVNDPDHIIPGSSGLAVKKIQEALNRLEGASFPVNEANGVRYGQATCAAVIVFKTRRNIFNTQSKIDNIVGQKTIRALDKEMQALENVAPPPTPVPKPVARSCALAPDSPYASWPAELLETLCRSYKAHGTSVDGRRIDSLPEAFQFGMEIEPANFDEVLNRISAERVKAVYERVKYHPGLWSAVQFISITWQTDNAGFKFSVQNSGEKLRLRTLLDLSPRFARDIPVMQVYHQAHPGAASKILVPTHQCWREVISGSPGLHICLASISTADNEIHVDPNQIVKGKNADGTCNYDPWAMLRHGTDILGL